MTGPTACKEIPTAWIPLPDGTRLAAPIWLPDATKRAPVPAVLKCLPYRRRDVTAAGVGSIHLAFLAMFIVGARIDLRGRGKGEGVFDDAYSETEVSDAEAVIMWIAAPPWCSGKVGMAGISWGGVNALRVAARRPPALEAVISIASTVDRFADDIHDKGGVHLLANLHWATRMPGRISRPSDAEVVGDRWREMWIQRLVTLSPLILPWLRRMTLRSPLDCGADGGEFSTQGADADLTDAKCADHGMSACFDTVPLDAALDLIGPPTLRLPVVLDGPQGTPIARLLDMHPDGVAQRPPPALPPITPPGAARRIRRDRASACTTVTVEARRGKIRHPVHGMQWSADRWSEWSIRRCDPLSREGIERRTGMRRRAGVETFAGGKPVSARTWSDRIARDHM